MSNLVALDKQGAFGPAMTFINNAEYYTPKAVLRLANLLKKNFLNLSRIKPTGKKEFCAFVNKKNAEESPISPLEVISTRFFQNMQKKGVSVNHQNVLKFIIPGMMKKVREQMPETQMDKQQTEQLNDWTAKFLESYMTEDQISKHCAQQGAVPQSIMDERMKIGQELYQTASNKEITEEEFDLLIDACQNTLSYLEKQAHFPKILYFVGKYLSLFSMQTENPKLVSDDVFRLLPLLKAKMFPKS